MKQESSDAFICALLVNTDPEGRLLMHEIFRKAGWRLYEAGDRKRALQCLESHPVQVVIASRDNHYWPWQRVLHDLERIWRPPQLVVTSRIADDFLWAEVLNRGGYDVLLEPFQPDEVVRVIASARRHFDPKPAAAVRAHAAVAS